MSEMITKENSIQTKLKSRKAKKQGKVHGKIYTKTAAIVNGKVLGNTLFQTALLTLLILLFIEGFEYKQLFGGLVFFIRSPIAFLLNYVIIFLTFAVFWLLRRRVFFFLIISVFWLALGITNGLILMNRMTPFTTADLTVIDMAFDIMPTYFSNVQLAIIIVVIVVILLLFLFVFIFVPKRRMKINYKRAVVGILIVMIAFTCTWAVGIKTEKASMYFQNLWDAYYDYGVPYCFLSTWLNKGIKKPLGYSAQAVSDAVSPEALASMTSVNCPNIIFLQLESFIDPEEVSGLTFSETPVPYFKELKENYSSGYLTVPVVGGGTANTEFEIMAGMSMRFFGPGEYPYKNILKKETCETMAYNLKRLGYATHAIHNHRGAFYNRNIVFSHLGYDDFTSLEYMSYVSKTPKNFAMDDVLHGEIMGALNATEEKDYIYAISVQGHGEYPTKKTIENPVVRVSGTETEAIRYGYEYYLQQIREMDDFVRGLTAELSDYEEDVVLVLYGDHLPALGMKDAEMQSGSTFKTEYVIWTNFELEKKDMNLAAYQLSAEVQKRIGMREGTLTVYHQDNMGSDEYLENLHLLQYDMLYGKKYVYGEKNPFEPTEMNMGYRPIRIEEIVEMAGQYYISGEGFTPFSKVSLDGKILDTVYMGPTVLKLEEDVLSYDVSRMKVSQVEKYNAVLSTTE
ncbi:MAG: LTA synthase family protein [Clostridiales Family XIII bacterium]|jgi:phosphoglycerol transferase MdoB-like AlkP superfamily enzyme|nr:LTA synthase family protein [Clostridiales Family XIII bacterium]